MLYLFDFFNSVFFPRTATLEGILVLMEKKIRNDEIYIDLPIYLKDNFYDLRINAESYAKGNHQINPCEPVSREKIYEALSTIGNIGKKELSLLIKLENKLWRENILINNKYVAMLNKLIENNKRVVFIIDSVIDINLINEYLLDLYLYKKTIPIYYKRGKIKMELFEFIKEKEKIDYINWNYIGYLDCESKININLGLNEDIFIKFEDRLLNYKFDDYSTQVMIGASRITRKLYTRNLIEQIGSSIGGPILYSYSKWIIQRCYELGIKRLYFIARDGFIPKKIIDIMCREHSNISTNYIYGSRKAWRLPSYNGNKGGLLKLIKMSYPNKIKTLKDLSQLLEIEEEEVLLFLPQEYKKNLRFTPESLRVCMKILDDNDLFRKKIYEKIKYKRVMIQKYLKQEIDFKDDNFAFVEIGGTGFTQECLSEIMSDFYLEPIKTFYLKLDKIPSNEKCLFYNFLPTTFKNHLIIELLSRAIHEQSKEYEEKEWGIVVKFDGLEGLKLEEYGYQYYIDGVLKFVKEIIKSEKIEISSINVRLVLKYLKYCMSTDNKKIVDFFAGIPHDSSGREKIAYEFAPSLTKKNIRDIFLCNPDKPFTYFYDGTDLEYAINNCSNALKKKIEFYKKNRIVILDKVRKFSENIFSEFPYSYFGKNFILYGAGKWGKQFYFDANNKGYNIICWLDKDYLNLINEDIVLEGNLEYIKLDMNFDVIFIAIRDASLATDIKNKIINRGFSHEKIILLHEYICSF